MEAPYSIKISAGDIVSITVFPVDEYSKEVTVQPDGKIELPLIGSILAKGLTPQELQDLLQQKYARYVSNPQVTVNVRRFSGRRVAIIGEVRSPGYYEFREGMRLLELVSLAGGITDAARSARVQVLRTAPDGGNHSVRVNFKAVLAGRPDRDIPMIPGDTVFIPKKPFTAGASWVTNNILPWAALVSLIASAYVIQDKK